MSLLVYRVTLSAVLMVAIISGNTLVMAAYKSNFRLRTPTYAFLVSLALSDFLVGSVTLPLWIYGSVLEWQIAPNLSLIFVSLDMLSALASSFHLMAISGERYMAVSRPFNYETVPARCYGLVIALCWSLAGVLAAGHPLVKVYATTHLTVYASAIFAIGIVLPFMVIAVTNVGVFKVARRLILSERSQQRNIRKERKTAMTLMLVTAFFFIAWTPFFVVNMVTMFCGLLCLPSPPALFIFMDIFKWLHFSNSALNPILYAFRDKEMRRTFRKLLCCSRSPLVFPNSTMNSVSKAAFPRSSFGNVSAAELYGSNSRMDKIDLKELYIDNHWQRLQETRPANHRLSCGRYRASAVLFSIVWKINLYYYLPVFELQWVHWRHTKT